ncbi:MAG TPA: hypothetical protein VGX23_00550 [Actinocrinis sp.]|nr:hypothetical protein [Actinocrinis sp.]
MIYGDFTGNPIDPPLRGRRPAPEGVPEPTEAVREVIIRAATEHPKWSPREIYEDLRFIRHDIPLAVVESVLAEPQRTQQGRKR